MAKGTIIGLLLLAMLLLACQPRTEYQCANGTFVTNKAQCDMPTGNATMLTSNKSAQKPTEESPVDWAMMFAQAKQSNLTHISASSIALIYDENIVQADEYFKNAFRSTYGEISAINRGQDGLVYISFKTYDVRGRYLKTGFACVPVKEEDVLSLERDKDYRFIAFIFGQQGNFVYALCSDFEPDEGY